MVALLAQDAHHAGLLQGREVREQVGSLGAAGKLGIVERVDVRVGQGPGGVDAHLGADCYGHALVVARENLDVDAARLQLLRGGAGARLGRVEKCQVADEDHVALVGRREGADAARVGLLRHGDDAHAGIAQLADLGQDAPAEAVGERAHSPARHLAHSVGDGLVDEVAKARLEAAVEVGVAQHPCVLAAHDVHVVLEDDAVLGEGAGLVAAQHVHGAQVMDGAQVLDDDVGAVELARCLDEV